MDLVVYDDDEKRYVPWAVALAALLLVALLTAGLTFLLARQASGSEEPQAVGGVSSPEPATAPSTPGPPAGGTSTPGADPGTPACEAALARADAALTRAEAVEQALADHTAIADELLAERITPEQALDRSLPVITDGATDRRLLDEALTAYRQSREECAA